MTTLTKAFRDRWADAMANSEYYHTTGDLIHWQYIAGGSERTPCYCALGVGLKLLGKTDDEINAMGTDEAIDALGLSREHGSDVWHASDNGGFKDGYDYNRRPFSEEVIDIVRNLPTTDDFNVEDAITEAAKAGLI